VRRSGCRLYPAVGPASSQIFQSSRRENATLMLHQLFRLGDQFVVPRLGSGLELGSYPP
jgi:hypothetical protein